MIGAERERSSNEADNGGLPVTSEVNCHDVAGHSMKMVTGIHLVKGSIEVA